MPTYSNDFTNYYLFLKVALPVAVAVAVFLLLTLLLRSRDAAPRGEWSIIRTVTQNRGLQDRVMTLIQSAGFDEVLDPARLYQIMAFIFLLASLPFILTGNFGGLFFAAILAAVVPLAFLYYVQGRRQALIDDQLIAFFNEMASRMKSKEDPQSAFIAAISNADAPLFDILVKVERNVRELKSFPEALIRSRASISSTYYQDFVDAVQISDIAGGRLSEIVTNVIIQINDKKIALRKLRAALSAINFQMAIIFVAPPLLSWMMMFQNPDSARILFGTPTGWAILGFTLVCYGVALGFALGVKRSVARRVS